MNYAIIRKDYGNLNIRRPFSAEITEIGECSITFLSVKYRILLKPLLAFLKIDKILEDSESESPVILEFLLARYKNIAICASTQKTLAIIESCAVRDMTFFIPTDNPCIVSAALEQWGITVFVSPVITADLLLYFEGDMPHFSENTFVVDFSDNYIHNTINTEYIKNISFKTYNALSGAVPNLKIQGIY